MKKMILVAAALIALIGIATIKSTKNSNSSISTANPPFQSSSVPPNTIVLRDFSYAPSKLAIKKGTKVTWTNRDDAHHTVTPTSGANDFVASQLLGKDESYEFTFNTAGIYTYKCEPHPYMKGTVEVTE